MNISRKYKRSKKKQSKLYTAIALFDVIGLAACFSIILKAM